MFTLEGESLIEYYESISASTALPTSVVDEVLATTSVEYHYNATFQHGTIAAVFHEPTEETVQLLLQRFARVFEQTYTRFLDLKQAEAQAREAQIEAALERVRSRAMAMHESNELEQVVAIMFEQLSNLGFEMNLTNVSIIDKNTGDCVMWATAKRPDGTTVCRSNKIPYIDHPCYARGFEAWIAGEEFLAQFFSREEKDTFLRYFFDLPHLIPIDEAQKKYVLESPGWARSSAFTKHGVLEVQNYQAIPYSEEENDILKRFARVFEQTYTRFLDLKKAEAQAREAQIETALERVRSRTMAMHESDELAEAASVLFQQLQGLGGAGPETLFYSHHR